MIVCTHGDVANFCKKHDMVAVETYEGDLLDYRGKCRILVTNQEMQEADYYYVKSELMKRGVELVSTKHKDHIGFAVYMTSRKKSGGRCRFGCQNIDGEQVLTEGGRVVVKRILELRDLGYSYHRIRTDENVHHPDGRKLAVSTIQIIISNRKFYEKEGL